MTQHSRFDQAVQAYAEWVLRWRWPILLAVLLLTALAASGGRFLWFDTSYRVFFSKENPQLNAFEALEEIYTKSDNILFVLAPVQGEVFTASVLDAVEHLTREAWKIPYSIRVDSVTNFQHTRANGDELIVADLVAGARALPPPALAHAKRLALAEPTLLNRLVSARAHVTGVNVTLQMPGADPTAEVPEAVAYARKLADEIRAAHPGLSIYLTGIVMLNNAFSEIGIRDMQTLVPLMYLGMFLIMLWLLRSLSGTFGTLLVISLSGATAMGLAGWWGVGLTPPSAVAPTLIMTLAVADSMHILLTMLQEMRHGRSKREALIESLRINMQPVFLTSLTTAIGFLSMNFSDAPPFRHLGNITAVGVLAAFVHSVLFLPAVMALLPVRVKARTVSKQPLMDRCADFVVSWRRVLLWGSVPVVLGLAYCISLNELNDRFVNYFDERVTFRTDTDFAVQNLSGIYQIQHSLGAGESGGISEPAYLAKLEEFATWYRAQPEVVHVNTLSDTMKRLNRNLHGDDPAWYRLPANRNLAAQYLLLYELSLPYGLDLNNQINIDKSATRLIGTLKNLTSRQMRELAARSEAWLRTHAPASMFAHGTGGAIMFSYISERNIKSMLGGTLLALVIISATLAFALRSVKFGAISLLPNLVPAVLGFGAWGLLVGQVNLALSVVTGMTLGIVVDDTVHFLSKYLRARREQGLSAEDSVRYAFSTVGLALVGTSFILIVGFLILAQSPFDLNAGMSKLTALTIVFALLADLFMLPPLLIWLDSKTTGQSTARKESDHAHASRTRR